MFFKISVGFGISNCLNVKKYIWNAKYIIQHRIGRSQATKCIQYTIEDKMSCELPKYRLSCNLHYKKNKKKQ